MPRRSDEFGVDPISFEEMTDPVIDQAGHTFDRSTINALRDRTPQGQPVLCPLAREVIDVNRLVPNRFGRDAIEREKRMLIKEDQQSDLNQRMLVQLETSARVITTANFLNQELRGKIDDMSRKVDALVLKNQSLETTIHGQSVEIEQFKQENETAKQLIKQGNKKVKELEQKIKSTEKQLAENIAVKDKQIENLRKMNFCDKVWCIFDMGALEKIISRGISQKPLEKPKQGLLKV